MKVYKIVYDEKTLILGDMPEVLNEIRDFCNEMVAQDSVCVEVGEMTEEEYNNLPEFTGW
jgi:hypothetical protein